MPHFDIYFDYASPFAYLASEIIPAWSEQLGVTYQWKPIEQMRLSNYSQGLPYSEVKRRYVVTDAIRSAEYHGVAIGLPKPHPVVSTDALHLAAALGADTRFAELHRQLFLAAWRDQLDISSRDVLAACIKASDGEPSEWLDAMTSAEAEAKLAAFTAEAEALGVFGVPAFVLDDELFWGLDSLPVLEWRLEQSGGS